MPNRTRKVVRARFVDHEHVVCASPGLPHQTASALEVSNGGLDRFTSFQIPVYMMERALHLPSDGTGGPNGAVR
eukprot:9476637-Pyramimonas_sp.AAC.1